MAEPRTTPAAIISGSDYPGADSGAIINRTSDDDKKVKAETEDNLEATWTNNDDIHGSDGRPEQPRWSAFNRH
jgi:hypothetical protein